LEDRSIVLSAVSNPTSEGSCESEENENEVRRGNGSQSPPFSSYIPLQGGPPYILALWTPYGSHMDHIWIIYGRGNRVLTVLRRFPTAVRLVSPLTWNCFAGISAISI